MAEPLNSVVRHVRRLVTATEYNNKADQQLLREFHAAHDQPAFAALVERHGAMVLRVCRSVLRNREDAEDAFQATFLVLARKAGSLRRQHSLAGWLHSVAHRVAMQARRSAGRRQAREARARAVPSANPSEEVAWREVRDVLNEEIERLPERYRTPFVLFYLDAHSQTEIARQLDLKEGTVWSRLARARRQLQTKLARRGIEIGAALSAAAVADAACEPVLLGLLAARTIRAVTSAGAAMTGIPPEVTRLVHASLRSLAATKLKLGLAALLIGGMLGGVSALQIAARKPAQPETEATKHNPSPPISSDIASVRVGDHKPFTRRDQDGEPLPDEALARFGTTRFRHGGLVDRLVFTPDGRTLVSIGGEAGMRLWDVTNGKETRPFSALRTGWKSAISPDGKMVAALVLPASRGHQAIVIHDFTTGRRIRAFGKAASFGSLLFSPDGRVLAVLGSEKTVELWDPHDGRLLHTLEGHQDIVWSAAFSPDGNTLISSSDDKTVRFWNVATGKEVKRITHANRVGKIALSPDGKLLACIDLAKQEFTHGANWRSDHRVRLWDTETGRELRQFVMPAKELSPGVQAGFYCMAFAPNGKTLVTGEIIDGTVRVWDPATGRELRQYTDFAGTISAVAFAPDGKSLAVGHGNSAVRLLDLATGKDRVGTAGHWSFVSSAAVMPACQTVVTTSGDGTLRFWDLAAGRELRRRTVAHSALDFRVLPDGKSYLAPGGDKLLRLHDLATGKERAVFRDHDRYHYGFAVSPDYKMFASSNADKTLRLIDLATGNLRHTLMKVGASRPTTAFSADGKVLVVWSADKTVSVWDTHTGKKLREFLRPTQPGPVSPGGGSLPFTAALSPDGELLAFGFQNLTTQPGEMPVVSTISGNEIGRFTIATDGACRLTFSPDGRTLAWAGWRGGTVYLGEIATARERCRFNGHRGRIYSLDFSADGKVLVSSSEDTTAMAWDLTGRVAAADTWSKPLTEKELESSWTTLAGEDAAGAYRAIQALAADPTRSVPYVRARLHRVAPVEPKRLTQLLTGLASDQFQVRAKAAVELENLSEAILPALRSALRDEPTLETRRRLEKLMEKQERQRWSPTPARLRAGRALEVLERAHTAEAQRVLEAFAAGATGAWLTQQAQEALARLSKQP